MNRLQKGSTMIAGCWQVKAQLAAVLAFGVVGATGSVVQAEPTRTYELEGFGHFLDGNPLSTAVTEDGTIVLAPAVKQRFADSSVSFTAACGMGDQVLVARAEDAQVLAIDGSGTARPLFAPTEPLVTALWSDGQAAFVATAPGGKIYRVDKHGTAKLFYDPNAKFVWQIAAGPDDSLLVVTGEPATLQQIGPNGQGKVRFTADQAHLRSVAFDAQMGTFVGGGERGVLYHAAPKGKFLALYDSGSPEITAIALADSAVYIAAVSGAASLATEGSKAAPQKAGEVRSQVLRVDLEGATDLLAGSADEAVFALAVDNQGQLLVATGASGREDPRGRIYRIEPHRRQIALLIQSTSRRVTHLVHLAHHHIAAVAAGGGEVVELTPKLADDGFFLTQPFDATLPSTFGALQVLGQFPTGTKVVVRLRTGQTASPDSTWSAWSAGVLAPGNQSLPLRRGRFVQACLRLQRFGHVSPQVQRLRLAYRRQNMAPFVREVTALHKNLVLRSLPREDSRSKVVLFADKADAADDDSSRRSLPMRVRQVDDPGSRTIKWIADDPNADDLLYSLYVRPIDDASWKELAHDLTDPYFTLQPGQLADGNYVFRVFVSDAPSNTPGLERTDSRDSRSILFDSTPPAFMGLEVRSMRGQAHLTGQVRDALGSLTVLTYSLDAAPPQAFLPEDGVLDGPAESLNFNLGKLAHGRHVVSLRAVDDADNEAIAEVVFTTR
jgi:hypothetical protein